MAKTNARFELASALEKAGASILAAEIVLGFDWGHEERPRFTLPPMWSRADYFDFSAFMDHEYDSGFGGQNLYGTVWLTDGSWLERGRVRRIGVVGASKVSACSSVLIKGGLRAPLL